eukprot:scaffold2212_cov134-Isochrysis_galbana.AAC.3
MAGKQAEQALERCDHAHLLVAVQRARDVNLRARPALRLAARPVGDLEYIVEARTLDAVVVLALADRGQAKGVLSSGERCETGRPARRGHGCDPSVPCGATAVDDACGNLCPHARGGLGPARVAPARPISGTIDISTQQLL